MLHLLYLLVKPRQIITHKLKIIHIHTTNIMKLNDTFLAKHIIKMNFNAESTENTKTLYFSLMMKKRPPCVFVSPRGSFSSNKCYQHYSILLPCFICRCHP